jgi:hypothetical protein
MTQHRHLRHAQRSLQGAAMAATLLLAIPSATLGQAGPRPPGPSPVEKPSFPPRPVETGADRDSGPGPREVRPELPPHHPERRGESRTPRGGDVGGDLLVLERLLSMPPEHLARIREAIERIEQMNPEERAEMRDRLRQFRHLSPEQRERMREQWREMTPEERRERVKELREKHWEEFFGDEEEKP